MEPDEIRRLHSILDAARKLPMKARKPYLDEACGDDASLQATVARLLALDEDDKTVSIEPERVQADVFPPGELVAGRFRVLHFIGRGGMGEVYSASDLELGGPVALKTVRPAHANDGATMTRFRREIQLARQVTHPNICRVFDVGRHATPNSGAVMFLTMEYLEGKTLRDHIKKSGQLPLQEAAIIGQQIAAGLGALHGKGIVHRDLKPANIMLTADPDRGAVIMDFGLARALDADALSDLTRAGFVVGTPGYMSPEQLLGESPTAATDIFSLGVVLIEMITGRRLAPGAGVAELRTLHLPAVWEHCLSRCLEHSPQDRPATAVEAVAPLLSSTKTQQPADVVGRPASALAPGIIVGEYRVIRLIGKGGMGEVYVAEDVKLGREVALKVLPQDLIADPGRRRRFELEAKAVSRLNHPNSASVYGFGEWSGGIYLATELVEGETLEARLERGPLAWDEIARAGIQLAEVLQAAHDKGITHRDIKPPNIMLSTQGPVKLLDFGIAKLRHPDGTDSSSGDKLTLPGLIAGSVGYMSPEQALGKAVDARADIFSLGIVLYEMAAARRPFAGATAAEVLSKILTSPAEPLARWNYETPGEMERIIRKCLEKAPSDRYQSALEVAIDLRSWMRIGATGTQSAITAVVTPPPARSTRRKMIGIGAGAAVAASAGGWGLYEFLRPHVPESVAILPFINQGSPEDEILSDGLTEALIDQIAGTGALRVMARSAVFRFKKIDDPVEVARKLGAAVLVYGRFEPSIDLCKISLEVVDVLTSAQRWKYAASTSRAGLQNVSFELVEQILRALGIRKKKAATPTRIADPEAYQDYLRGRHALNRRLPDAFAKASELFRKSIERDPLYAAPYSGLADVYNFQSGVLPPNEVCPKAKAAAVKALELDPNLAEAHASLGWVQLRYEWAWKEAEASFQKGIQLNPSYASAHSYYARLLTARKRFDEAEKEQRKAIALDPLSSPLVEALGMTHYYARQFDKAEGVFRKIIIDEPTTSIQTQSYLGLVYIAQRNYQASIDVLEKSLRLMGEDEPGIVADLGTAYALKGDRTKALDALARVQRMAAKDYVPPYVLAGLYLSLGEREKALEGLEKSVDPDHSWAVMYYAVEPKLDPLRREPRFQALLRRTGAVLV